MKIFYISILISLLIILFSSCGGVKNSFTREKFTLEEKEKFETIYVRYIVKDTANDMVIEKSTSDTLLSITGYYKRNPPPPYKVYEKFEYQFTKESGLFVARTFKNYSFVNEYKRNNFLELLSLVLDTR